METVVAKALTSSGELSFMHPKDTPGICPKCGSLLEYIINNDFKLKKKNADFLYTYDHYCIVSENFRDFCQNNQYENLNFTKLPESKGFYFFQPNTLYYLDSERRKIKFINYCDLCGNYLEVIGATPAFTIKGFEVPQDFIYRSNYVFGTKERKHPLIIVGLETEKKIKKAKLKGIYFDKVYL